MIWEAEALGFFEKGAGMRLINADEIQYAKDWVVTDKIPKVGGYNAKAIYRVTKEEIDAMPTVDAVPVKHGKWTDKDGGIATCSVCGDRWGVWSVMKYCPNCGAKMDGKEGDQNG